MDDYLRKAVELADGWAVSRMSDNLVTVKSSIGKVTATPWLNDQATLDALAAQLVRQLPVPTLYTRWHHDPVKTIQEIVDSGVLPTGDS